MNLCMVDITEVKNVSLEDEAVLIGTQKNQTLMIEDQADIIGTIHYEVAARLSGFLPRKIV